MLPVSIHASAKEATFVALLYPLIFVGFNPRLREGGDKIQLAVREFTLGFNPRLREGGDKFIRCANICMDVSIHASAKEATDADGIIKRFKGSFNPRLREGGDYVWRYVLVHD